MKPQSAGVMGSQNQIPTAVMAAAPIVPDQKKEVAGPSCRATARVRSP